MARLVIQASKTEPKCKLCTHPERAKIDEAICQRSNREINGDALIAKLGELQVENPTLDNVKNHLKRHCTLVEEKTAAAEADVEVQLREIALQMFEDALGEDWREQPISAEALIDLQRRLYAHELSLRLAAGLPSGITTDHVLKGVAEQTKRKQEEGLSELFRGVGRGVEAALKNATAPAALPAAEVIDAEDAEVVDESQ